MIVLPIMAYLGLAFLFLGKSADGKLADAFAKGHIAVFLFIAISTEILSIFDSVNFASIVSAWLILLSACVLFAIRRRKRNREFAWAFENQSETSPHSIPVYGTIAVILTLTFITAILYPPNTYDSMTYHMARVSNWIVNESISYYPTAIPRQNYIMPLAEFAILHLQILTHTDFYANLVQWVSFFVLICLVRLISTELGLGKKAQMISSVIAATIPMAILQSTSTQNDLVVAVFILSFALFMLRLCERFSLGNLFLASVSLGLALLTKGTAYLFCAPIGIILSIPILLKTKSDKALMAKTVFSLMGVAMIALLANSGLFWRNYQLYSHPMAHEGGEYWNYDMSLPALAGNMVKNATLHAGVPSRPANLSIYRFFRSVLGKESYNPKTTYDSFRITFSRHEDSAGNQIHLIAMLICLIVIAVSARFKLPGMNQKKWYGLSLLLGFIIFCWLLKWQPWSSRLHTPLFAMSAPLIASVLVSGASKARRYLGHVVIACMILFSFQFLLSNSSRPLMRPDWKLDRMRLYFQNRPHFFESYQKTIRHLEESGVSEAGLYIGNDDWEYPFWALAGSAQKPIRFRHVGVDNISGKLENKSELPVFVIATKETADWKASGKYVRVFSSKPITLLKKNRL